MNMENKLKKSYFLEEKTVVSPVKMSSHSFILLPIIVWTFSIVCPLFIQCVSLLQCWLKTCPPQIRQQSSHFLRGIQQLIQKEWINMFNEHEFQVSLTHWDSNVVCMKRLFCCYIISWWLIYHCTSTASCALNPVSC